MFWFWMFFINSSLCVAACYLAYLECYGLSFFALFIVLFKSASHVTDDGKSVSE